MLPIYSVPINLLKTKRGILDLAVQKTETDHGGTVGTKSAPDQGMNHETRRTGQRKGDRLPGVIGEGTRATDRPTSLAFGTSPDDQHVKAGINSVMHALTRVTV